MWYIKHISLFGLCCSIFRGIGVFDFNNGKQSFTLQLCSKTHCIKHFISVKETEINNEELIKRAALGTVEMFEGLH